MNHHYLIPSIILLLAGCARDAVPTTTQATTLAEARRGFRTTPSPGPSESEPVAEPPGELFRVVEYDSPAGKLKAYLTTGPGDGGKRPAIVWITGGDCNSIGDVWEDAPRGNDQTAAAYRKAGVVMMFPSLRGGNDNPGRREGFFGEVDDVLAAADYLAAQDYVDPTRIYLGGHSTGGTLAMLVTECSGRFRATFAFGPVSDVSGYGPEYLPFDASNLKEVELRSPGLWLPSVRAPLFVIEGADSPGNADSLSAMARASTNPRVHFLFVNGFDHFSVLGPVNELIAEKIVSDDGPQPSLSITEADMSGLR